MEKNKQVIIDSLPEGKLVEGNYRLVESSLPQASSGEVLVKTISFAITAGTRAGLQGSASYAGAPKAGIVMNSTGIGEVVESAEESFPVGSKVLTQTGWQDYSLQKIESLTLMRDDVDPELYLGPLGINGLTAYFGLLEVGDPKSKDTVMVSAAAGSVGHMVGQIAKIKGCHVIGVCGNDDKCNILIEELGFDTALNYKDANFRQNLKDATPNGLDVYFDNTGGMILGSALFRMNTGGRIACCGVVSQYDTSSPEPGPRGIPGLLINNRIKMEGFLVFDFAEKYDHATSEILEWIESGDLKILTDKVEGLEAAPRAFVDLLAGGNIGTRIVRLS
ncbi:MAG TPA: NADP-dependent oxidoreductase [Gammaproteobacteria bacterium]|jgi:NADPH-dependent curcumin reductase CurA|nr:NADP-dependent oxidoreductase [Gammaproteobacteria bacterium]